MFYLIEFFRILKKNLLLGFIFISSLFLLISLSHFQEEIEVELSLDNKIHNFPYFNALLKKDVEFEGIKRRMAQLPGVLSVELGEEKKILNEVSQLKKIFNYEIIKNLSSLKYHKIKVELEKGLKLKNQTLIKEYFTRLVGKDSVTIGKIKVPNELKIETQSLLFTMLEWAQTYIQVILFGLWFVASILLFSPIAKKAYIIERFQRKKFAFMKIYLSGITTSLVLSLLINISFKTTINSSSLFIALGIVALSLLMTFVLRAMKTAKYGL